MESFLDLLDLERVDQGVFVGRPDDDGRPRVYGGHTLAQALAAACHSIDGLNCHSLHAYFVRPGLPGRPTHYEVSAVRDGSSFSIRQVVALQRDEVVLHMMASFHEPTETPLSHAAPMPSAPDPSTFPPEEERLAKVLAATPPSVHEFLKHRWPFEGIRINDFEPLADPEEQRTRPARGWLRARGNDLPSDPNFHCCALTFASDAPALEPCMRAVGVLPGDSSLQIASLDHALWFHRPFRFDDWLFATFESPAVLNGRAYSRGSVFDRSGRIVASVAQEGVLRPRA